MLTYALRRLLVSVPVLLAATFLIFGAITMTGDPLSDLRRQPNITDEQIERVRESRGLDQPLHVQYGRWVREVTSGGFGEYMLSPRPIWPDLRRVLLNTLQLVVVAELVALCVAVVVGVVAARHQYGLFDHATTTLGFLGYSMPAFWLALILQVAVIQLYVRTGVRLFPVGNLSSPDPGTGMAFVLDRVHHLVLPVASLAVFSVAGYSRYVRASVLEALHAPHVQAARARGLSERQVTTRHVLRNALIPTVTVTALSFGTLLSGAVVVETVFGLDGMGRYLVLQLGTRDPYPIMAWLLVVAVVVVLVNLLADLAYGRLDPRIRHG